MSRDPRFENIPSAAGELRTRETVAIRRISWGAVWGGVMVALGVEALMTAFGLFIGFLAFNPAGGTAGAFKAWSWAWFWVTSFVALYAGGYSTVRLSGVERGTGSLNGLVTWGLTTIATVVFSVWTATGALTSAAGFTGNVAGVPSSSIGNTAWSFALLFWIGISIGALAASMGGKKAEI